jgi:trans-4-hydroxy-L-proline dehydratase
MTGRTARLRQASLAATPLISEERALSGDDGVAKVTRLVGSYFLMGGHHVQFNVVGRETLREAMAQPEAHRSLIVRVAGYSDYFCDLSRELQDEIIAWTEHC